MRRISSLGLMLVAAGLGGCGDEGGPATLTTGMITVGFSPRPIQVQGLSLGVARMRIGAILVIGNVPPPPPPRPMGPGPTRPPNEIDFDALSSAGSTFSTSRYSQGLYSGVLFIVDRISLEGVWRTTPFRASLGAFMGRRVDLRSSTPQELGPGLNAEFDISVDPGRWFIGGLLDSATITNGQISIDDQQNSGLVGPFLDLVAGSFSLR